MKKWLLLALLLSGCFFQEQNNQGSEWVDELNLDIRNRTKLVQIKDLNVTASTSEKLALNYSPIIDTVMYQADLGVIRTLTGRLLLGSKELGTEVFDNELFLDFDVSDSLYGSSSRERLYHVKPDSTDLNPDYDTLVITPELLDANLQLNLADVYYDIEGTDSLSTPDSLEFEVKWFLEHWVELKSELTDEESYRKDTLGFSLEYWERIVTEDVSVDVTGSFVVKGSLETIVDTATDEVTRTFYKFHFDEELKAALIDGRDSFSSLSFRIKAKGLKTPLYIGAPNVTTNSPVIEINNSPVKRASVHAYQTSGDRASNSVYAGIADTLELVPDYKQIAEALKDAGFEAMSNNSEVILSAVLKVEMPDAYSYESSLGNGSWLKIHSFADSNKYRDEIKVSEYQVPVLDSILKTENASYWVSNTERTSELSWMVGYGMRTWFNYSLTDAEKLKQAEEIDELNEQETKDAEKEDREPNLIETNNFEGFKLVLLQGNDQGDTLSITDYDGFNRMAKLDLVDFSQLKWSLDLVVLNPGEEL